MDSTQYIANQVKAIVQVMADIDPDNLEEDSVEVLIGYMSAWGVVEAQVLFPALETQLESAEPITGEARKRLNVLYELQNNIHEGEGAEGPFSELAPKYIDAVKYHLLADVQEIVPLAAQLPEAESIDLASSMAAAKLDME
jgi:hemerythrin-like domain-containing protein